MSNASHAGLATRLERDAAHRIVMRLLRIIEPCFRGDELLEFYRKAMPVVAEGIRRYSVCKGREEDRLRGRPVTAGVDDQATP